MSEKIFLVMAQGFDYNDEYYFQVEGGHPDSFFSDLESAQAAAEKKNIQEYKSLIKDGSIREYSYDGLDGLLSDSATEDDLLYESGIFMTLFGTTAEKWYESGNGWGGKEVKLQVEPTEEQWKKLVSCFNLNFYEVVTVERG